MALTKANVRSRLASLEAHPATPQSIKSVLNRLLDSNESLGRSTAQVSSAIDSLLDSQPATLDAQAVNIALGWIVRNWENLPD